MTKKVAIVGSGELMTSKAPAPKRRVGTKKSAEDLLSKNEVNDLLKVVAPLPVFKEIPIGTKFKYKGHEYKKTSSFAGYRAKVGLYSFGAKCPVEISIINK